jgi:hypothetical protein
MTKPWPTIKRTQLLHDIAKRSHGGTYHNTPHSPKRNTLLKYFATYGPCHPPRRLRYERGGNPDSAGRDDHNGSGSR